MLVTGGEVALQAFDGGLLADDVREVKHGRCGS